MKRIAAAFFLCNPFLLFSACFQPLDGINLWRLTEQVGDCVNYYGESTLDLFDSTLDVLDTILCSVGNVISLVPADFAAPYVISVPGYYKVCDNITASTTLTIASDDVVVDLGHYYLDGVSIVVESNHKNIIIKNGLIRNVVQAITVNAGSQNVTITGLTFDDAVDGASPYGIKIVGGAAGIALKDLSFFNAAPQAIVFEGSDVNIITQAVIEDIRCVSTNQGISATIGSEATFYLTFCEATVLRDISVTDPYQGLDVIALIACDGVTLEAIDITSDLGSTATARGVYLEDCNNIEHNDVSVFGEAFVVGFTINTSNAFVIYNNFAYHGCSAVQTSGTGFYATNVNNIAYEGCEASACVGNGIDLTLASNVRFIDCVTNSNGGIGLATTVCDELTIASHYASSNTKQGMRLSLTNVVVVTDATVVLNTLAGILIDTSSRQLILTGCYVTNNRAEGFRAEDSFNVSIDGSSAMNNDAAGFYFDNVDNIVVTGCSAQDNGHDGFHMKGVNNGSIPTYSSTDDGVGVGQSPVVIENCSALTNAVSGFYFTNVGGVKVEDSFASYNGGYGFHFDSGSWNVQVIGCVASSNADVGFMTWDFTAPFIINKYNNRFHACHAGRNRTGGTYLPGPSDFGTANAFPTPMVAPIGGPALAGITAAPDPLSVVAPDFCTYN